MVKVGIVTWFADYNYGTKLQAYALQEYLNEQGYKASIINYVVPIKGCIVKEPNRSIYKRLYGKLSWIILKRVIKRYKSEIDLRNKRLDQFFLDNCRLTFVVNNNNDFSIICNQFDYIITGSDQIWNPNWYNPVFYADFPEISAIKVAYAPSFGTNCIGMDVRKSIENSLNGFYKIGIREKNGQQLLSDLFGIYSTKVVDPTLLLDKKTWMRFVTTPMNDAWGPYIFCYMLSDNLNHWRAIKKFAKKKKLKLIVIPKDGFSFFVGDSREYSAGIERFLSLIYNSNYVITDSFHACVFSVVFNKIFIPIERFSPSSESSQNTRIYDFLEGLNIYDILQGYNSKEIEEHNIDWNIIMPIIESQVKESKRFLDEALDIGIHND